jgi:hypothetical protein
VIRADEAFHFGSEMARAGTYTDADTGCSARSRYRRITDLSGQMNRGGGGQMEIAGGQAARW